MAGYERVVGHNSPTGREFETSSLKCFRTETGRLWDDSHRWVQMSEDGTKKEKQGFFHSREEVHNSGWIETAEAGDAEDETVWLLSIIIVIINIYSKEYNRQTEGSYYGVSLLQDLVVFTKGGQENEGSYIFKTVYPFPTLWFLTTNIHNPVRRSTKVKVGSRLPNCFYMIQQVCNVCVLWLSNNYLLN